MSPAHRIYPEGRVSLREVGLRDGLQLVKTWPATCDKFDWLRLEHAAGVRHFEIGSFLPATRFPQFADIHEMIDATSALEGAFSAALTLNERGVEDALETKVNEIIFVVSATEEHSQANTRRSRAEAVAMAARINERRLARATPPVFTVGVAMAFGCSLAGAVDPADVLRLAEELAALGVDVIAVADTVGHAGPAQVAAMAKDLRQAVGETPISMHFHDTRGLGIANCAAALDGGIRILDASLSGLGGCPFAPGATGNVAFEDVAFLCETMGFDTGIDIAALAAPQTVQKRAMPGEAFHGTILKAGLPRALEEAL